MTAEPLSPARARHLPVVGSRTLAVWLLTVVGCVFATAIIGAVTRLTESGLSITDWRPIGGILPPLTDEGWQSEFNRYRQIGEYQLVNRGMTLDEFKYIFFWEWLHRVVARLTGLVYALPLVLWWVTGRLPRDLKPRLALLLGIGITQAVVGWLMVASGLGTDVVDVSHLWLALHLSLAMLLYAGLLWTVLDVLARDEANQPDARVRRFRLHAGLVMGVLALTFLWGVFTAGLDAGRLYGDPAQFPLMGRGLVPEEALTRNPVLLDPIENPATVQFLHRCFALLTVAGAISLAAHGRRIYVPAETRRLADLAAFWSLGQAVLGVATLLTGLDVGLAAAHQAGAIGLLTLLVALLHSVRGPIRRTPAFAPAG